MLHFIFGAKLARNLLIKSVGKINSRRALNEGGRTMIEKLIKRGYKVVTRDEAELTLRKAVIIDYNGNFGVSYAAIDARGRYFEGGSHPPQAFRALELARWREERRKQGPLPIGAE